MTLPLLTKGYVYTVNHYFHNHNIALHRLFSWYVCVCGAAGEGRSELDELQEEVTRRAREQEMQRRKEKEKEAAMGFNPRPSKFMDLDELQSQGEVCM